MKVTLALVCCARAINSSASITERGSLRLALPAAAEAASGAVSSSSRSRISAREALEWVPGTTVSTVERCSGHDGTWGVKTEFYAASMRIGRPVFRQMADTDPDYLSSDCPIAARAILQGIDEAARDSGRAQRARKAHPLTLMRIAYGLE